MSEVEGLPAKLTVEDFEARVEAIDRAPSDDFTALVQAAGLNPARDLRFGDFTGCDFAGQILRGFDFTGCDLTGAAFNKARIDGAVFDCARASLNALSAAADFKTFLANEFKRRPAGDNAPRPHPDERPRHPLNTRRLRDFDVFQEAAFAPAMVVLPAGKFSMGSTLEETKLKEDDKAYYDEVGPLGQKREMSIAKKFAIGKYPVTFDDYEAYCAAENIKPPPNHDGGRGNRPVINVSWDESMKYAGWLNGQLGLTAENGYRLPSEAEWEYACRAGTDTRRWWGDDWDAKKANGAMNLKKTSPVDAYAANPWGLHDTIGNVCEWCGDAYVEKLADLPQGGGVYNQNERKKSLSRVLRGGSWSNSPRYLRAAYRSWYNPDNRGNNIGFRLARTV